MAERKLKRENRKLKRKNRKWKKLAKNRRKKNLETMTCGRNKKNEEKNSESFLFFSFRFELGNNLI
jgi:hypothetical protein